MLPTDLISVVVTTYNRSDALAKVLEGLSQQTDSAFEVIVADDGSTQLQCDAVCTDALALGLELTHVWHPDVGFTASRARNRGVSQARGDYVVFLDGDCIPEIDFVAQHRRLKEPGCLVNGSRVLLSPAFTQAVLAGSVKIISRDKGFWLTKWWRREASKLTGLLRLPDFKFRKDDGFSWRGIRSCNMGVWRSDFERVNGFDESFVGWGHEDADFVLRMHNAGVARKNGFCATEVYHLWHAESSRDHASSNAQRVMDRMQTRQVIATEGYLQSLGGEEMIVNRWR
jgi:glycosyltransferase involved in cell wall biosynthesis